MKYLDLFSGIGGFALAAELTLNFPRCVGFSEIEAKSIQVYKNHFPRHKFLGPVEDVWEDPPKADLVFGGFPCQDLSVGKKGRRGLKGKRSGLFFLLADIINQSGAEDFVIENVGSMRDSDRERITDVLEQEFDREVFLTRINSKVLSAQMRSRYYWTTFEVGKPVPADITLSDIMIPSDEVPDKFYLSDREIAYMDRPSRGKKNHWSWATDARVKDKSFAVIANFSKGVPYNVVIDAAGNPRKWMAVELERLQTFPRDWTEGISYTARCKALGNAVTVDVVRHILNFLVRR